MASLARVHRAKKVPPKWPTLRYERKLWREGLAYIAGADEAGRGALAGPVYAAAVILPSSIERQLKGVRDSKQMKAAEREALAPRIRELALAWAVASASVEEIDEINILQASHFAEPAAAALAAGCCAPDRGRPAADPVGERGCALPEHFGGLCVGKNRA